MRKTLRTLGNALRYSAVALVIVLALAFVAAGIAWEYPDLWLRESTLARAALALKPSVFVSWASTKVSVEKQGFFVRRISLDLVDLRVEAGPVDARAQVAQLDATFRVGWNGVTATIDKLNIDGQTLAITVDESDDKKPSDGAPFRLPSWLEYLNVVQADVKFGNSRVTMGNTFARFSAKLDARPEGRGVQWHLAVVSRGGTLESGESGKSGEVEADAQIRLSSLAGPWFGPYTAKVYVRVNDPALGKFTFTAAGTPALEGTSSFRGSFVAGLKSKVQIRSTFGLALSPNRIDLTPSGKVLLPSGPLAAIEFSRCPISVALPVKDLPKQLRCDGAFQSRDPKEKWDGQRWVLEGSKEHWTLAFSDLVGVKTANAKLVVDIADDPETPLTERKVVAAFEAKATDYAALAKHLYPGELSIPQPFASLAGDVTMKANWIGRIDDWSKSEVILPWSAVTKLASKSQRFQTTSAGTFHLFAEKKKRPFLEADVALDDVALDMPDLALSPIRVLPDGRIKPFEEFEASAEASPLHYRVTVKTPTGRPVTLQSNLAAGPIPITVNLLLTDDAGPRGSIGVHTFPVEFFHRRGELERLQVSFAAKGGRPVIDGSFRVRYAQYVITLKAIGPAEKPTFEASSEPPLPQRDVWAALLFGRKLEGDKKGASNTSEATALTAPQAGSPFASRLSNDDKRSADEMQAAAVDGGVSLATMYLLASTPVESVSYNPASGEVRAAVRLADGAALTVGSDLKGAGSLGFRYRLGRNWYVTTTLEDTFDFTRTRFGTRLEWTNRY